MRLRIALEAIVTLLLTVTLAGAQSTTGTISGRVVDLQNLSMPGVTVEADSPNLQGVRVAITSENGDYIISLLPPGIYTVTFDLSGFQRQQRTVSLAPGQEFPLDVTMGPAALSEVVEVVGLTADLLVQTAQVATKFRQELVSTLPTTRDIDSTLLLAPSVHTTGPSGNVSIAGSMSFENLFLVNGVTVNENIRGQAFDLYIEDAIQETTVATAGISAEYGRFGGGVVNIITKSGGNTFSGSFRDTLNNDDWRSLTPFEGDTKVDKVVPTYEYTFGGPALRDQLWFFTAGRVQDQETARQTVVTNIPLTFTEENRRYEGKVTFSLDPNHRFQGAYTKHIRNQENNTFNINLSMDVNSYHPRQLPEDLITVSYSGILSPVLAVDVRYSARDQSFIGSGAPTTDLIFGTLLLDRSRNNTRYWSPTFCGVCTPERRDNENYFAKASYFLSTRDYGSHNFVAGFDSFNDIREANNHQSGSDYRILGTSSIIQGTDITPQFLGNGTTIIQWNPIPEKSIGSDFRTYSVFLNDSWRVNSRLTANLGVRWDKNDGRDQSGALVARDSAWSPRAGVVWDPTGAGAWSVTGSFARYVAAIANSIAGASSAAGNPQTFQFIYRGPDINANPAGTLTSTPDAVRQVFDWFFANGGPNLPTNGAPSIPGLTPQIQGSLISPSVFEYAGGINRQFGARAAIRADLIYRNYQDFYVNRTDLSTGRVTNQFGRSFDLTLIENSNDLEREHIGLSLQGNYRFDAGIDVGGNYTVSRTWGNVDGETVASGPVRSNILHYPEYRRAEWNEPVGDLGVDQRHRSRFWVNYNLPWVNGLTLSVLQLLESGIPYGANPTSGIDPRPFVTNPGYLTPPPGSATTYYYTDRDAFRTEGQIRTDFAANYTYNVPRSRGVQLFGQLQVINLFNNFQLCGCGATVFANGGGVNGQRIDQTVLTSVTAPTRFQAFNPFTTTPVEGVNWALGPNFGKALNRFAYTTPRAFRVSFGVRF